ncbi:MAG: four helix bundle protein [Verrucomicrobia bacterium]|nr:four helix bundle protein [Verrucomicrobiota bacterium]
MSAPPPLCTVLEDLAGWTLDRTSAIPKNQRFTFGQRLDGATLEALLLAVRARYAPAERKRGHLENLNVKLEELRVLWRFVQARRWISQQQLLHVNGRIDEAGRMAGGWLRQVAVRAG